MRRSTRFGLIVVVGLLVLVGAYTTYWWMVGERIKQGIVAWQQSESSRKIDASWRNLRVTGFPLKFRVEIDDAVLRGRAWSPPPELHFARLSGAARPWNFNNWRLSAPQGLSGDLAASGSRPLFKLVAPRAKGTASLTREGGGWLWLNLENIAAELPGATPIKSADVWIILPAAAPKTDREASFGLALDVRQIQVQSPPANFSNTIDRGALGLTVKGAVPDGPLVRSIAAWRDAGGTIEVDNLRLEWGDLGVTANGTVALDRELQPIAAFSADIEGFATIINALVSVDGLTPEQGSLIQIALSMLAKPGPDGRPRIAVPFTIQNSKMYLGPARLGPAPRIVWE